MPRKTFVAGEILTAADVNSNLMDQAVMVFDNATARDTAIPSPIEGMVVYLKDTDGLLSYSSTAWVPAASGASLGAGTILQVVSTFKNDVFSTTSSSFVDVTGFSVTITPKFSSSKVFVLANITASSRTTNNRFNLLRDSTNLSQPSGGASPATMNLSSGDNVNSASASIGFLDSPNTTSATTYKIQMARSFGTQYVNRDANSADNTGTSSITVFEVAA